MSNNKQSSVEQFAIALYEKGLLIGNGDWMQDILNEYKAMHKEEMIMFVLNVMGSYRHGDVLAEVATELYEQTFGGNK